jgi:hypothetical protein
LLRPGSEGLGDGNGDQGLKPTADILGEKGNGKNTKDAKDKSDEGLSQVRIAEDFEAGEGTAGKENSPGKKDNTQQGANNDKR